MAFFSQGKEKAVNIVKDKLLPKNPQVARKELLRELKKNLEEMKKYAEGTSGPLSDARGKQREAKSDDLAAFSELVGESEGMVVELEAINNNITLKEKIADRVLDVFSSEKDICVSK